MTTKKFLRFFVPTIIVLVAVPFWQKISPEDMIEYDAFRCVISLDGYRSENMSYDVGYNYEMLNDFASAMRTGAEIMLAPEGYDLVDSLVLDSVDIVVVPYADTLLENDSIHVSKTLVDGTVWLVADDSRKLVKDINNWLSHCEYSPEYDLVTERFTPPYHPQTRARTGRKYKNASPYDELIKKYAARMGWDWRMLAKRNSGFKGCPRRRVSKCKWEPNERPVLPPSPIGSPALTSSLTLSSCLERCP